MGKGISNGVWVRRCDRHSTKNVIDPNIFRVLPLTFDRQLRYRGALGECAARLEGGGFVRVHRSYLVNPEHVLEITPFFGGTYLLRVDDKLRSEVPVSRSYVPAVKRALGI